MFKHLSNHRTIKKNNIKNPLVQFIKIMMVSGVLLFSTGFAESGELTLNIKYLKKIKGQIFLEVLKNEDGYEEDEPELEDIAYRVVLDVSSKEIELTVKNFPAGKYVARFFQDLNGNGKLDTNLVGVPKEPYGFSNGEKGSFGPPDYEDIEFEVVAGQKNFNQFKL